MRMKDLLAKYIINILVQFNHPEAFLVHVKPASLLLQKM